MKNIIISACALNLFWLPAALATCGKEMAALPATPHGSATPFDRMTALVTDTMTQLNGRRYSSPVAFGVAPLRFAGAAPTAGQLREAIIHNLAHQIEPVELPRMSGTRLEALKVRNPKDWSSSETTPTVVFSTATPPNRNDAFNDRDYAADPQPWRSASAVSIFRRHESHFSEGGTLGAQSGGAPGMPMFAMPGYSVPRVDPYEHLATNLIPMLSEAGLSARLIFMMGVDLTPKFPRHQHNGHLYDPARHIITGRYAQEFLVLAIYANDSGGRVAYIAEPTNGWYSLVDDLPNLGITLGAESPK